MTNINDSEPVPGLDYCGIGNDYLGGVDEATPLYDYKGDAFVINENKGYAQRLFMPSGYN